MVQAKKTSDSYRLDRGAWPMPCWYDSYQRRPIAAVLPSQPKNVTQVPSCPEIGFLKTQAARYKKAARPYTNVTTDNMLELIIKTPNPAKPGPKKVQSNHKSQGNPFLKKMNFKFQNPNVKSRKRFASSILLIDHFP